MINYCKNAVLVPIENNTAAIADRSNETCKLLIFNDLTNSDPSNYRPINMQQHTTNGIRP